MRCARTSRQTQTGYGSLMHVREDLFKSHTQNISLAIDSALNFLNAEDLSTFPKVVTHIVPHSLLSLHRFLQRIARHPTLQRSTLVRAFFESTEWVRRLLHLLKFNLTIIQ